MEAPDREHRDRARLSLDASVVVEAGAGTGKTTLLTDRILFLVLAGEAPPSVERVVALTFTDKAAAEIKVRLSDRLGELVALLSGASLAGEAAERARRTAEELRTVFKTAEADVLARARAALEDLDKAPIGTIHSFCSQVLRLYPVEAGVDPGFRVDADGRAFDALFASEWAKWLDDELGEDPPRKARWLELLAETGLEDLEALARELSSERLDPGSAAEPDRASAAELRTLAARAAALPVGRPKPRGGILDALLAAEKRLLAAAAAAEARDPSPGDDPPAPKRSSWPKAWEEDEAGRAEYERILDVAEAASPRGEAVVRRAAALTAPFAERVRREFARRGWVSFDGLVRRARDLVRDRARPREELKKRFAALLIDEFQDTDPLQGELLLYLSEAPGRTSKSWTDVVAAPGRLFVVGDPKQSIYRFRGADIGAYEGFLERFAASKALACDLTANFRSVPGVVTPVNDVFTRAMRAEPGAQPAYKPIAPARKPGAAAGAVTVVAVGSAEKLPADDYRRAEAEWIARRIAADPRPRKDFALLLRSSSSLWIYLEALKRAGLPYAVEIERDFYDAPEVGDLLNLLRALDDPEDRAAVAGLLRSPLAALTDDSLLALARERALDYRKDPPPKALPEPERAAAAALFETLRALRAGAGRRPLGELVADAISRTRLLELAGRAYHGQQSVSNLLKLQRKAAEGSETRGATLKEFTAEVLEASRESRKEGESPLADEHLEAVRVLTMHKSKGLEYPVVFAANLSAKAGGGDKPAARPDWRAGRPALRVGKSATAAAALAEERESRLETRESVRLLYVAMTRAREELVLLGRAKHEKSSLAAHLAAAGAWPVEGAECFLPVERLDAAASAPEAAAAAPRAAGPGDGAATARAWADRARARRGADAPLARAATAYLREAPRRPAPPEEGAPRLAPGAEVGQLLHRALQDWDFKAGGDARAAVAAARRLLERRAPGPEWASAETEAAAVLGAFAASDAAKELAKAEILGREVPFAYADGATVVRGAADILYRAGGRLVVADWKSERVDPKTAAKVRAKYAAQGEAYVAAVSKAWGEEARFRVIFLRAPEL